LHEKGIIRGKKKFLVKVLGNGTLSKNLKVEADLFSKSAVTAIEGAGGSVVYSKENESGDTAA